MEDKQKIPDAVPLGLEIEYFVDKHDLPIMPWQRDLLLKMFPNPSGEEQPKINLTMNFNRRRRR